LALHDLARSLQDVAYVILPDLPGTGESDAPGEDRSTLDAAAQALGLIADGLGLDRFTVAAIGCGCAVATLYEASGDRRLAALVVEDVPIANEAVALAIAPEIPLTPEGSHWLQAWLMIRDGQVYRPWFDGRIAAQRQRQGNFDADWLHDQTFDLMKSRTTYHRFPQAAYRFETVQALERAKVPVHRAGEDGLSDMIRTVLGTR
jgi:pimeloyl-ACP methyl ester carboxylesterase